MGEQTGGTDGVPWLTSQPPGRKKVPWQEWWHGATEEHSVKSKRLPLTSCVTVVALLTSLGLIFLSCKIGKCYLPCLFP